MRIAMQNGEITGMWDENREGRINRGYLRAENEILTW